MFVVDMCDRKGERRRKRVNGREREREEKIGIKRNEIAIE